MISIAMIPVRTAAWTWTKWESLVKVLTEAEESATYRLEVGAGLISSWISAQNDTSVYEVKRRHRRHRRRRRLRRRKLGKRRQRQKRRPQSPSSLNHTSHRFLALLQFLGYLLHLCFCLTSASFAKFLRLSSSHEIIFWHISSDSRHFTASSHLPTCAKVHFIILSLSPFLIFSFVILL